MDPHKEEKDIDLTQVDREDSPDGSPWVVTPFCKPSCSSWPSVFQTHLEPSQDLECVAASRADQIGQKEGQDQDLNIIKKVIGQFCAVTSLWASSG